MSLSFRTETLGDSTTIYFEGELNIYSAAELKAELLEFLDSCNSLTIDLDQVTSIDTAGVQILILLKKESDKENKKFILKSHNLVVLRFFDLYGLTGFFADKISISKEAKEKFRFSYGTKLHPDRIGVSKK
ncbi:MAG: STAS domain-containing protein [Leptospiraceae bacterium]|nr:STAS domain-containing protein [Leptospiraceae bacterium]MCK6381415.1 STAS domain-containing protein [Leptospiraceae bacterium]NUM41627.1 STAS domain-containing protein [Leptospiraceae bacterium]